MIPHISKQSIVLAFLLCCSSFALVAQHKAFVAEQFVELPDPTKDTLADWSAVAAGLHSTFASIDVRYAKSLVPQVAPVNRQLLSGWKGEVVAAQVLLWTSAAVEDVNVEIFDFKAGDGTRLARSIASARFVRYVMTDEFAGGCGARKPEDFAASLSPDMLDNLHTFTIEGKTVRPVWVRVDIPRDAKSGKYTALVHVKSKGQAAQDLKLDLEVIDRLLPEAKDWTFHLDQWQHPSAVARAEGIPLWSDAHFAAMKPLMQRLAAAGQKVITTTLNKDPWHVQTYDPYADMIRWTKGADGRWAYDYTIFDRWVEFMLDLGVTKMINCYSIIPWNNEIHYHDAASNELVNVVAKPGTAVFQELWSPFLQDFVRHLRSKGWLDKTNIAIDERSREEMDAALELLTTVAPELGISYADNQKTYQRYPNSRDISIGASHPFSAEDLIDRRARGLTTTFYVCCSDAFPNQFTFSDPAESAYLGWYAEAAGFDGLLRWAYNSWVENPLLDSRFRTWPAGDTYIVYPYNRSSIRYERLLEGIQDYEKLQLVKKWLLESKDAKSLARLVDAIGKLNSLQRTATWNADLNQAKALLNELSVAHEKKNK